MKNIDYGLRYFDLNDIGHLFPVSSHPLNILFLADDAHPANVVRDHIQSFLDYSTHKYTIVNTRRVASPAAFRSADYDVILIHYSIYILGESYLSHEWGSFISGFHGVVSAIHEDEYQNVNAFKSKFMELGVQAIFSCLDSVETMRKVYKNDGQIANMLFVSCLPGYIQPKHRTWVPMPIRDRKFDVIYRGRELLPELGKLGQEKRLIAEHMKDIAEKYGLNCDLATAESARIYGDKWNDFLMSGKTMLGVEGGASIFDFDGHISEAVKSYREAFPAATFDEIWKAVLEPFEGNVNFRTITPKFFEAIAAGTVLLLYPGRYNGFLIPGRHYIPFERDGSNVKDIIAWLRDDNYLQAMADRTREEILMRDDLLSSFYVTQIDQVISQLVSELKGMMPGRLAAILRVNEQRQSALFIEVVDLKKQLDDLRKTTKDIPSLIILIAIAIRKIIFSIFGRKP